jgi:hypothetical protein
MPPLLKFLFFIGSLLPYLYSKALLLEHFYYLPGWASSLFGGYSTWSKVDFHFLIILKEQAAFDRPWRNFFPARWHEAGGRRLMVLIFNMSEQMAIFYLFLMIKKYRAPHDPCIHQLERLMMFFSNVLFARFIFRYFPKGGHCLSARNTYRGGHRMVFFININCHWIWLVLGTVIFINSVISAIMWPLWSKILYFH